MRIRLRYLMAAGAIAALSGAPAAAAEPSCTTVGGSTTCSSPGNTEINATPPGGDFTLPYWDETFGDSGYYPGPYPVPYNEGSGDAGSPNHR
jgi:hypothetical protein